MIVFSSQQPGVTMLSALQARLSTLLGSTELHAVYVLETRTGDENATVGPDTVRQNLREDGKEALSAIEADGEPDVSVITSVREEIPHEEPLS